MKRLVLLLSLLAAACAARVPPPPAVVSSLPDPELGQPRRLKPRPSERAPAEVAPPKGLVADVEDDTAKANRYAGWSGAKPDNLPVLGDLTAAATRAKKSMLASCHHGRCGKRQVEELLKADEALSQFLRNKQG